MKYDFGSGDDDSTSTDTEDGESACEDIAIDEIACDMTPPDVSGCLDAVEVTTAAIDESAGCTPAGQALGIVSFETTGADAGPVDLFAWVAVGPDQLGPFAEGIFLSTFEDECGDDPFGESDVPNCDYEGWLVTPYVFADAPVYAHVQTLAPTPQGEPIELGYQIWLSDGWTWPLPADAPLECLYPTDGPPPGPHLSAQLVNLLPWNGEWLEIDVSGSPPALGVEPRICPSAAGGWRQIAFQLRNPEETQIHLNRIQLGRRISPLSVEPVPFHFEILSCQDSDIEGGVVLPGQSPLASSCHDDGEHASKQFDLLLEPWATWEPETQYVLILQVPPTAGAELELRLQAEVL